MITAGIPWYVWLVAGAAVSLTVWRRPHPHDGCVYFIADLSHHVVKIGYTTGTAEDRLGQIQRMSPRPLTLLYKHPCQNPRGVEARCHKRLAKHRLHGEWFPLEVVSPVIADLQAGRL